jgi:FSR family fosmidomycin resistance protein-like MFS transporter
MRRPARLPTLPVLPIDLFSRGTNMRWDLFKHTQADYYIDNYPEILDLKVNGVSGTYDVVGLTNWQSAPSTRTLKFTDKLGLIFISSGTAGLAVGPTYFSAVSGRLGLLGTHWAALPGLALSAILLLFLRPAHHPMKARPRFDWEPLRAVRKPMTILFQLVFIRSIVQINFTQFLPLYLHTERGYSLTSASLNLTLYLGTGAIGGVIGGNLADRFGGRRVILFSMIASAPFLALFVFTSGWISTVALATSGLILLCTNPVNVVLAQQLAPSQTGTVSALMMGFAWGTAGLVFIPLTGWISDLFSMQTAFVALTAFPLLGFLLALKLPKHVA